MALFLLACWKVFEQILAVVLLFLMRDVCSQFYCSRSYRSHHLCAAVQLLIMVRKWVCSLGGYGQTRFCFYYIKTNSVDTCEKLQLNKASDVGLMLTLGDKSYLSTSVWPGFVVRCRDPNQDSSKALPTWEWTVGSMNLNSSELWLNWPLCVKTPDGKRLFLSLSAMKTWPISQSAVSGMLRFTLDWCRCWCIQTRRLRFSHSLYFYTRMQSNTRAFFAEWNSHAFPRQIRPN